MHHPDVLLVPVVVRWEAESEDECVDPARVFSLFQLRPGGERAGLPARVVERHAIMRELLERLLPSIVSVCEQDTSKLNHSSEVARGIVSLHPLAPTPPTGKPGTAGLRTVSFASAAPLLVLEKTATEDSELLKIAQDDGTLRTCLLEFLVLREHVHGERGLPARMSGEHEPSKRCRVVAYIPSLNESNCLVDVFHGDYQQDGSEHLPESELIPLRWRSLFATGTTYSPIRASSAVTSLTIVGATYFFSTSTSPPQTISPLVRFRRPCSRAACSRVTMREKESEFSGPSG